MSIINFRFTYSTIIIHNKNIPAVIKLYADGITSSVELYTKVYIGQAIIPDKVSSATINANTLPISSEGTVFDISDRAIGLIPPPKIFRQEPNKKKTIVSAI